MDQSDNQKLVHDSYWCILKRGELEVVLVHDIMLNLSSYTRTVSKRILDMLVIK